MQKITKALTLLLFLTSLSTLTSCKKTNYELIIGQWKCIEATKHGQSDEMENNIGVVWNFTSDRTMQTIFTDGITYETKYEIEDDILTIIDDDSPIPFTITKLTNNELILDMEIVEGHFVFTKL